MKGKLILIALTVLVFLSVSCVWAENETALNNESTASDISNAEIIADDFTARYSADNEYSVLLVDDNGDEIPSKDVRLVLNSTKEEMPFTWSGDSGYGVHVERNVGKYEATVVLNDSYFHAKPVTVNLTITKSSVKLNAKVYYTTQKSYATMKTTVRDLNGKPVSEGTVKFTVNSKSYTVKVKNGVAVKKVKLSKSKAYQYKATFTSANYVSKSVKSKIYVYATSKKARTFSVKGYKIVVPLSKYKKLVTAKNTKTPRFYEFKTNKIIKQKYRHYYNAKKYVIKSVKARAWISFEYGGYQGLQNAPVNKYSLFLFTRYQGPDRFCTPHIGGIKISGDIAKLEKAKTRW